MNAVASVMPADPLVYRSSRMARVVELARRVALSDANVLLAGESGTGKGILARFIHDQSPRRDAPFVTITCANIPAGLLESELFGHEKGAFTGATERRVGRFEQADGGTILIDGVSELAPGLQGKLLRVLQEKAFERLAGTRTLRVDVRVLASTQAPLEDQVARGEFRADLFYRLNVVCIEIPPLRDRMEDLPALVEHILREIARHRKAAPRRLAPAALDRLLRHDWPGNVRELRNALEGASIAAEDGDIPARALRLGRAAVAGGSPGGDLLAEAGDRRLTLAELEERYIREVLRLTGGNRSQAARILGINRKTLLEKRKRYGIP
jgi:DNA-binding NtrC family response regulator